MNTEAILEKVRSFATSAHEGQRRKYTPEPYIVHPVRVMEICRQRTRDICVLSAALLHDVLEDTAITKGRMAEFLHSSMHKDDAARTLRLVVELTDVYVKQAYPQYNRRRRKDLERQRIATTSPDAQTIKYADIIDNCREIVQHDRNFARVFLHECRATLKVMTQGDGELYGEARNTVEDAVRRLGAG